MKSSHHLDWQIEMPVIIGQRSKTEFDIKGFCSIGKRFHSNRVDSQFVGRTLCATQGIHEQQPANSLCLEPPINGKSAQENDRHWMTGKILGNRFKCNRPAGDTVVSADGDRSLRNRNIGPAKPTAVVLTGIPLQEEIESGLSTIELRAIVTIAQWHNNHRFVPTACLYFRTARVSVALGSSEASSKVRN